MTTTYITAAEVASYLEKPAGSIAEDAIGIVLVNGLLNDILGDLNPIPFAVKALALEVAARGFRNPQAYTSVTVGIDDYDKTVRREGKAASLPGFYLTDDERAQLYGLLGVRRSRVGSIRLAVPDVS